MATRNPQPGDVVEVRGAHNVWYKVTVKDEACSVGEFEAGPWVVRIDRESLDWRYPTSEDNA